MADRTVFASTNTHELARYNRAGKWYLERRVGRLLQRESKALSIRDAVNMARAIERDGGKIRRDLPGGQRFYSELDRSDG